MQIEVQMVHGQIMGSQYIRHITTQKEKIITFFHIVCSMIGNKNCIKMLKILKTSQNLLILLSYESCNFAHKSHMYIFKLKTLEKKFMVPYSMSNLQVIQFLLGFSGWESNCQLTFNNFIHCHFFCHNVNFKSPNLENMNSLSIFFLKTLPIILRKYFFSLFFIFIFLPKNWGHHKTPIPIVEKQLGVQAF